MRTTNRPPHLFTMLPLMLLMGACADGDPSNNAEDTTTTGAARAAQEVEVPQEAGDVATTPAPQQDEAEVEATGDVPILSGPAFRLGGRVATGKYVCRDIPGEQMKSLGEMGSAVSTTTRIGNQFEITSSDEYAYISSEKMPGEYRYNSRSAHILFTSGPYSSEPGEESTIEGFYGSRRDNDLPVVILIFRDPAYGETYEYCVRTEQ